jgi:putative CocE/NonD family hydrolase
MGMRSENKHSGKRDFGELRRTLLYGRCSAVVFLMALMLTVLVPVVPASGHVEIVMEPEMVPMRDGTHLATNIYRIAGETGPAQVLLLKTGYGRTGFDAQAKRIAERGYIAITQDSSGRFGSTGEYMVYWGEPPDGFDTVTWIREQPWCDGQVGMWGGSYMGSIQWLTACTGAPLSALAPTASCSYFYHNVYNQGGAIILSLVRAGFGANVYGPPPEAGASPKWPEWYLTLPLMDFDDVVGYPAPMQMNMIKHYTPDGFWRETDARNFEVMDFPAQHIVGYYDFMCWGSVYAYQGMRQRSASAHSRNNQQLIIGPWDHGSLNNPITGDVDFGENAGIEVLEENLDWYDRWFKGIDADKPYPRVRYFMMGTNEWREADEWPPRDSLLSPFYLHSSGGANTRNGNGRISQNPPTTHQPADRFKADPADPVPAAPAHEKKYHDGFGPRDQQLAQDRKDVLVYQTELLDKPISFAGTISAELYISTNTPDADFVVKVVDVHPDGFAHPLAHGILRASARESLMERNPLVPDEVYLLNIHVGHSAATVKAGHRLAVQIQGSHFPVWERNANTGEGPFGRKTLVSTQVVYHDPGRPSRVLLPLVEME